MKFKIADIKRIEIFAPGTAGERAIRVETFDGNIEILNQLDFHSLNFIKKEKIHVIIDLAKLGEDHNASGYIYFDGKGRRLVGESLKQCWDKAVEILKNENLEFPNDEDFQIEDCHGTTWAYWQNFEDED